MSILERIQRIARANISQLLNQVETPDEELEEKISDLENAANDAKDALASFAVSYKRLENRVAEKRQSITKWQTVAISALESGQETAARRALSERLKTEDRLQKLETVLDSRRKTYDELKDHIVEIHDQLNQARARMTDLRSRRLAAQAEKAMGRQIDEVDRVRNTSFDRLEEEVLEAEARTEIEREIRGDLKPLTEQFAKHHHQTQVDDALAELAQTIKKEPV